MKRAFDVVVAGGVLLLTLPILLVAGVAIWLESRRPVFSRHERVGRDGVHFELFALGSGGVTRVGRFLRWSSIDVLPQLWNVVRGDMSLVGPRPALPSQDEERPPEVASARSRLLPGITGMWQDSDRSKAS